MSSNKIIDPREGTFTFASFVEYAAHETVFTIAWVGTNIVLTLHVIITYCLIVGTFIHI